MVCLGLKNKAFTLAEVLITLAVIGVVAALTIPTLMQNANERATVSAVKKVYSTLSQAYKLAEKDNGTPDSWGLTSNPSPALLSTLSPYLNVSTDCSNGGTGCFPPGVTYKYLKPGGATVYDSYNMPKLKLTDGTLILGQVYSTSCNPGSYGNTIQLQNVCALFFVDVNGYKNPNRWGEDTFMFWLTKYGFIPVGSVADTNASFVSECKDVSTARGLGCTAWVLQNENLDYLHCNNLDWTGPTKCQ